MDINKLFQSKIFQAVVLGLLALIIILAIFSLGMAVGFKKANFSYQWGDNYHQNFAGPQKGFGGGFEGRDFMESHGVIGQIIKIDGSIVIIKGKDQLEKVILIGDKTAIMRFKDTVKAGDLKVDDYIVIIGEPNDAGQINAKLIRLLPAPGSQLPQDGRNFPPSMTGNNGAPANAASATFPVGGPAN